MRRERRAAHVSARVLPYENMTLLVSVQLFDVIFRDIAVSALVYLVLPTVAIARFHSMVSPVLVPRIDSVAEHFTAVQTNTFFSHFSAHERRVNASHLLLVVTVV